MTMKKSLSELPDDTKIGEFPAQSRERLQWILDAVRSNQLHVFRLIEELHREMYRFAARRLLSMQRMDRDALLQQNGILTDDQIRQLQHAMSEMQENV